MYWEPGCIPVVAMAAMMREMANWKYIFEVGIIKEDIVEYTLDSPLSRIIIRWFHIKRL